MRDNNAPLASIRLHPALVIIVALAIFSAQKNLWTTHLPRSVAVAAQPTGHAISLIGVVVLVFAYGAMALHRTTINPRQHTRTIVTNGIYRLSRNPIYIGWFLLLTGQAIRNLNLGQLIVAIVMLVTLHFAVVLKEEQYLENAFGDQYKNYKQKVRRWL